MMYTVLQSFVRRRLLLRKTTGEYFIMESGTTRVYTSCVL